MTTKARFIKDKPHQQYRLADGTRVPGVTTVLGIMAKPALLHWAWQCGMDGKDYRKARDEAADTGTLAHWLIECHLRGQEPDLSEFTPAQVDRAENALIKFLTFWADYELIGVERQLVHERLRYGGTLDILAKRKDGRTVLLDCKTSKAIYDEYWYQVAAYGELCREAGAPVDSYMIMRIGKEADMGDSEIQERIDLSAEWDVFTAALALYHATARTKKGAHP